MVMTLGVITLVSATAVGVVYNATKEPIEAAKSAKTKNALAQVLPGFEGEPRLDSVDVNGVPAVVYTVSKGGRVAGYAVESVTNKGFGGDIRLMTGFTPEGEIIKIEVLGHNETPGLGDKIEGKKSSFSVQFQGKTPDKDFRMSVRKDGGDVEAITASTISSRAYIDAVKNAWAALLAVRDGAQSEANTGATVQQSEDAGAATPNDTGTGATGEERKGGTQNE